MFLDILDAIDPEKLKTLYGTDADNETDITGLDLDSSSVGPGDDLEQDPRSEEEDEEGMDEEELNEIARLLIAERKAERKKGKVKKDGTSEKQEKSGVKSKSVTFNLPEDDEEKVEDSDDDDDIDNDSDNDDSDSFDEDEDDDSNKNTKGLGKIESTLTTGNRNKKKLKAALKDGNHTTLKEHSKELESNSDEEDDDEDNAYDDSDEEGEGQEGENDDEDNSDEEEKEEAPKYKEDIYGRLRDAAGNLVSEKQTTAAYVPPGKRLQMAEGDEKNRIKLERLRKQLKGLLNR